MIEVLPQSEGSAIGFKISGKVTSEDYDFLLPKIDEAIKDFGSINLLIMMGQFEGWTDLEGAKQDFKFGKEQYRHHFCHCQSSTSVKDRVIFDRHYVESSQV